MKLRASVVLLFGATMLTVSANAVAGGPRGGPAMGGHFAVPSRPFVDHRFGDRRFFFGQRPFFEHRRFFFGPSVFVAPNLFAAPSVIVAPPAVAVAPVAPFDPFSIDPLGPFP